MPVAVVPAETLDAMAALDGLSSRARFDHPAKLERLSEVVGQRVDVDAIYDAAGIAA